MVRVSFFRDSFSVLVLLLRPYAIASLNVYVNNDSRKSRPIHVQINKFTTLVTDRNKMFVSYYLTLDEKMSRSESWIPTLAGLPGPGACGAGTAGAAGWEATM